MDKSDAFAQMLIAFNSQSDPDAIRSRIFDILDIYTESQKAVGDVTISLTKEQAEKYHEQLCNLTRQFEHSVESLTAGERYFAALPEDQKEFHRVVVEGVGFLTYDELVKMIQQHKDEREFLEILKAKLEIGSL